MKNYVGITRTHARGGNVVNLKSFCKKWADFKRVALEIIIEIIAKYKAI